MRTRLAFALLCLAAAGCHRAAPQDQAAGETTPSPVPADFRLSSVTETLPDGSNEAYPNGPGAEAMNNNCRSCHSPSMVLTQPRLGHDAWAKEVAKMREAYKAPVADADLPAILSYLDAVSAARLQPPASSASAGQASGR